MKLGDTSVVFVANAYVRNEPSLNGVVIDSLKTGAKVIVVSEPYNADRIKGFYAPWRQITYTKHGQARKGFIWAGLLALGARKDAEGNQYIYGFERSVMHNDYAMDEYVGAIKVIDRAGELRGSSSFRHLNYGQSYHVSKLLSGMGLNGIKHMMRIEFMGEACGIPSNYYYTAWNGDTVIDMPSRYTVSDAGVFYHLESFLFPEEHQKEVNTLYKVIETGTALDADEELELDYEVERSLVKYIWDGKFFSELVEMKQIE